MTENITKRKATKTVATSEARSPEPLNEISEAAGQAVSGIRNILAEFAGLEAEVKSISRRGLFKIGGGALVAGALASTVPVPVVASANTNIEALYREWQRTRTVALKGFLYTNNLITENLRDARLQGRKVTNGYGRGVRGLEKKFYAVDEKVRILELRIIDISPTTPRENEIKAEVAAAHAERFHGTTTFCRNLWVLINRHGGTAEAWAHYLETGEV